MPLRVAIQMDPLDSINPRTDSTLLLGLEAQKRGHELWHYTPDKLSWRDGVISARARRVTFKPNPDDFYAFGETAALDLSDIDVVLLRQDPPFDMAYIGTTYILERLHKTLNGRPIVVNDPTSVRDYCEKMFPALFRQYMPPTLVTSDIEEIALFRDTYKDIVVKPLYGHGGNAVFRLSENDGNFHALMEMVLGKSKEQWVVQSFLPEVKDQERRIIMIDGEFAGLVGRIPAQGEIRANFRAGGTAAKVDITEKQREICASIGPMLKEKGLLFVGLDVIGNYLTEINITSPTGLAPINKLYNKKLEADVWDAIEAKL